jgi:hypothetical protein
MSRERIAYNPDSYITGVTEEVDQSYLNIDQLDLGQSYVEGVTEPDWQSCDFNCANLGVFNNRTAVTELLGLISMPTLPSNDLIDFNQTDGDGTLVWTIAHANTQVTMAGAGSKSKWLYVPFESAANVEYEFHLIGASSGVGIQIKFGFLDENLQIIGSTTASHTSGSKTIKVTPSQNGTYAFVQVSISTPSSPTFTFTMSGTMFFIADHDYVGLKHTEYPALNIGDRIYIGDTDYIGTYYVSARYARQSNVPLTELGFLISQTKFGVPLPFDIDVRVHYKTY